MYSTGEMRIRNAYSTGQMIDFIDFKKPAFEPLTAFRIDVASTQAGLVIPRTAGPVGELQIMICGPV